MYRGWVNGDVYIDCGQQQGILPFPGKLVKSL